MSLELSRYRTFSKDDIARFRSKYHVRNITVTPEELPPIYHCTSPATGSNRKLLCEARLSTSVQLDMPWNDFVDLVYNSLSVE